MCSLEIEGQMLTCDCLRPVSQKSKIREGQVLPNDINNSSDLFKCLKSHGRETVFIIPQR